MNFFSAKKQASLLLAAFAISLSLAGCGFKKAEEPAKPVYGVVDLETVVKAHPKYAEYFKLETEYNRLLATYKSQQQHIISISSTQQKINTALTEQTISNAEKEEYDSKVKAKEDEVNGNLKNLYDSIAKKHETSDNGIHMSSITDEEENEITNLQLKISVLDSTDDEKSRDNARLAELLSKRHQETGSDDMTGWTDEEKEQLMKAKEQAKSDLDAYAKSVAEDIKSRGEERRKAVKPASDGLPDADQWNADWQNNLSAKQKQMAAVKEEIMKDVRKDAAKVAQEKNLKMIFTKYSANVNAVDVTGDLVNAVIEDTK